MLIILIIKDIIIVEQGYIERLGCAGALIYCCVGNIMSLPLRNYFATFGLFLGDNEQKLATYVTSREGVLKCDQN